MLRTFPSLRSLAVLLMLAALAVVAAPASRAAAPPNDNFASATVIGALPFTDSLNTVEATNEFDDPIYGGNTVWYAYTPITSGYVTADTFGSDYYTYLNVVTGGPGAWNFAQYVGSAF